MVNRSARGDSARLCRAAVRAGWSVDKDNWWTRPFRGGEQSIGSSEHGFISLGDMGRDGPAGVYVRSARLALDYDAGADL